MRGSERQNFSLLKINLPNEFVCAAVELQTRRGLGAMLTNTSGGGIELQHQLSRR